MSISNGTLFAQAIHSFNLIFDSNDDDALFIEQEKAYELPEDFDDSRHSCIQRIGHCLSVMRDVYNTEMRRSTMLQEFLVNELNHTEELQASLRKVQEELNVTVKQRENYKKKCESQLAELEMLAVTKAGVGPNNLSSSSSITSESAADRQTLLLDQMLLGKFIGKKFPGYGTFYATVATYQKPYYKVVYEDGDCEDLTPAEVKRLLCEESSISRSTIEAIMRKSEEFDFDNPAECFTGLIDVAPGADELEAVKNEDENEEKEEVGETEIDWIKSEAVTTSSSTSSLRSPGESDGIAGSGVKYDESGVEIILDTSNGTSSSTSSSHCNNSSSGGINSSSGSDVSAKCTTAISVGSSVSDKASSWTSSTVGVDVHEGSTTDNRSEISKRSGKSSGKSNGKSSGKSSIIVDSSDKSEGDKNTKVGLAAEGTKRKTAGSIQPPAYNKNLGEKYVPCPHCQKMFHPSGIKNHMNKRCGKQLTTVGAATTTAAAGAAAGLGFAVSSLTSSSIPSPGGARSDTFQSPPRTGASSWSPISINSVSSSIRSDGISSNGTPASNGTQSDASPATSRDVKPGLSPQFTKDDTHPQCSSQLSPLSTTPLPTFSCKKRKHSPGSDEVQSTSKMPANDHESPTI